MQSSDLQRHAINRLLEEIYTATISGTAELELPQLARWSGIPLDTLTDWGKQLVESKLDYDIEAEEFGNMVDRYRKIDQIDDPGLRAWKLQALARKYKRPLASLQDAYNKALVNQATIQPLSVAEFKALHDREVDWLIPGWIPKATTLLLHADGGVGKTLFAYQLMESVLYGRLWNGYPVTPDKVLLVQTDEPSIVTNERIDIRGIGEEAPLRILTDWQVEGINRLEKYIESDRPALVIIDSYTSINRNSIFSENDTEYARPILELANLANRFSCTILIIHHSNAEGGSRGTRAIYNSVSEVWGLSMGQSQSERLLRVQKTRLGRPPGRYQFLFDDDDFSFRYLGEDMGEAAEASATHEDKIRLWLGEDEQRGKRFSTIELSEYLDISRPSARRACYELWAKGLIKRARPKGERSWLYYIEPESGQVYNSPCDQVITQNFMRSPQVITANAKQEQALSGMRSCDHPKIKNHTIANGDFERSHDHISLPFSQEKNLGAITSSDHFSDQLPLIENNDHTDDHEQILQACDETVEVGDLIVTNGTATWYRSGSDKLPSREVPKSKRDAASIPIHLLGTPLFHELTAPSKVLSISRDHQRVRVRNQKTGRTSVFAITDVCVLKKAAGVSSD